MTSAVFSHEQPSAVLPECFLSYLARDRKDFSVCGFLICGRCCSHLEKSEQGVIVGEKEGRSLRLETLIFSSVAII